MSSKNKARKIFKKLREAKLEELRKKDFEKKNKSSSEMNSDDFKKHASVEFNENNTLIGNEYLKLDNTNNLEVNANFDFNDFKDFENEYIDESKDAEVSTTDLKSNESKDVKESKDAEVSTTDLKSNESKDVKESKDAEVSTTDNEIFKDFQKSNENNFNEQNKLIGNIDTKLDKFEQKLFHSQGGEKTALQKEGSVSKLKLATSFAKSKTIEFGKDNPKVVDNMSSGVGFLAAGLASLGFSGIGAGYNFIKEKFFSDEKNESSTNGEVIQNTDELKPKDIEKMEAEEVKEQTKEKDPEKGENNTSQYLKKKEKSLLSYLPFFKEKEEYKLSEQVHNMLKTDGNLKEKELILNEVKQRDDVDKAEIKKLEDHIIKQREIEKEREEIRKSTITTRINMSENELAERFPEYAIELEKLKENPKYEEVKYSFNPPRDEELSNLWFEFRHAKNNLFHQYAKKYAATVDPTIMSVKNYKGEELTPEEYAPEYFKKETQKLANEAKVTIKNSSESVTGVDKSSASNNTVSLDNKSTSPVSVVNPKIEKESPISVENNAKQPSTSSPTPVEPQKEVKEGKVLPANASGSDTVSQSEAIAADNSPSAPSQEVSPTKSPLASATAPNASPSVPASVSPTTNSNNVELSGASKQLAKDTVGTEPKPDTITNESVVNNQVIEKVPESPWDKFNNAELTKSQDEFLRGK